MPRPRSGRRRESQPKLEQTQVPDWLDQLVDEIYARMEEGERPAFSFLLERLLDKVMERERERFLRSPQGQGEQANGSTPASSISRSPWSAMLSSSAPRSCPLAGSG